MKKVLVFAIALVTLFNCKEDKEFSTPSFEATKNNERWSAEGYVAYGDIDGNFNVKGEIGAEVVILTTTNNTPGTYNLTSGSESRATYTDIDGAFYSTENEPDPSLTEYPVGGTIIIDELSAETNSITGRFQFSAFTDDGLQGVTFSGDANRDNDPVRYGVFYRVNLFSGILTSSGGSAAECLLAQTTSDNAETTFNGTATTDANYPTVCAAYKAALEDEQSKCGDASGAIQAEIDALGTCM
jgi:hypothetical protein